MTEDRKKYVLNCIGNLSDFMDAFLIWVEEMIHTGDYRPGAEIRKASREEIGNFVRRTRCNVRVVQAILDAARHYEKSGSGISKKGLAQLHNEIWSLYRSAEDFIQELCDDHFELVAVDHPSLEYLSGPSLDILAGAAAEIERDFRLNIIPPQSGRLLEPQDTNPTKDERRRSDV
jgi:hypothetical protein